MKSKEIWKPSKYIYHKNKLIASRDRKEVGVGSRLIADLVANAYEENLKKHAKGQLLDLGCGHVPLYAAYKNYITKNICVDWENTTHKNVYLDFVCDITKPLPFSDEEFDEMFEQTIPVGFSFSIILLIVINFIKIGIKNECNSWESKSFNKLTPSNTKSLEEISESQEE